MKTKDGTLLHVETEGDDEPCGTVIFAHGFAESLHTWDRQREAFHDPSVRRLFYDHRGFGNSTPWTGESASVRQLGLDLGELVDAAPSSAPVTLVGHSMGTLTILALAEHRPELFESGRVSGVVLIGSPGDGHHIHLGFPLWAVPVLHRILLALVSFLGQWRADRPLLLPNRVFARAYGPRSPRSMRTRLAGQFATNRSNTMAAYVRACLVCETPDVEALRRTRVEIIHGTHDHLASIQGARELAGRIPSSTFHELPGCGHMVQFERAARVNRLIGSILAEIDRDGLAPSQHTDTPVTDLDMPSHSMSGTSLPTVVP